MSKRAVIAVMALSAEMVIMDVMAITAVMPIVTIIALMATMQCDSLNINERCYIGEYSKNS